MSSRKKRKILRDEINSITKPALRHISWRAGIRTTNSKVFAELRTILFSWLEKAVKDSVVVTLHLRLKTVKQAAVITALGFQGIELTAGLTEKLGRAPSGAGKPKGGTHRYRAGTVALRQVRKAQKQSDNLAMPFTAFSRLVREIAGYTLEGNLELNFSPLAIVGLQSAEHHLYRVLKSAQLAAIHAGRVRVFGTDVRFAAKIQGLSDITAPIIVGYDLSIYTHMILKLMHPENNLRKRTDVTINYLVISLIGRIMQIVNALIDLHEKQTVTSRDIQSAVRILFPQELQRHAVSEGTKAVTKYNAAMAGRIDRKGKPAVRRSRTAMAGLSLSVSRIEHIMIDYSTAERKSPGASIYLAAALELIIAEIMELAGNAARDDRSVRITSRHLLLAIRNDYELNALFPEQHYVIGGGVFPGIRKEVLKDGNR